MSDDPADDLASLAADVRGWLGFHRSLHAEGPRGAGPCLPPPPAPPSTTARSPGSQRVGGAQPGPGRLPRAPDMPDAGARRLPRAANMPAPAPRNAPRLPRASELPGGAAPTSTPTPSARSSENVELRMVRDDLGECTRCKLHQGRNRLVFGVGNPDADIVFVGEGPGYYEDRQGVPFVGKAGALLDRIINNVLRLDRDAVYICNVLKCRPPNNRDPEPDEIARCAPFLHRQLIAIDPKVVVGLGRFAVNNLLGTSGSLGRARGVAHRLRTGILVTTYHPAYLLRNPEDKRKTMKDMMLVRSEYERAIGSPLPPPVKGGGR